ncbi:MAG: hypothetical protein PHU27_04845 [Salinivirgaceae bacterium]|nr:hypothetical protein [Salinivirgaceae bacterium]MDD4747066.1 hypothetical protein [Salinivirgaceae bacterium]MDY0280290.1 hypothetical protein [Salinivirgaceae bacterium]
MYNKFKLVGFKLGILLFLFVMSMRLFSAGLACTNTYDHNFIIFDNGKIVYQDHNAAKKYWVGHNYIAFIDYMNTLRVYHDGHAREITLGISDIEADDSLFIWFVAGTLKVWNQGEVQLINRNVSFFKLNEGAIVYFDVLNRTLNVWYDNKSFFLDENHLDFPLTALQVSRKTVAWQTPEFQFKLFFDGVVLSKHIYEENLKFATCELCCAMNNPTNQEFEMLKPNGYFTLETSEAKWWKSKYKQFVFLNRYDDLKIVFNDETLNIGNHMPEFVALTQHGLFYDRAGQIYYFENNSERYVIDYIPTFIHVFERFFVYRNSAGYIQVWDNGTEFEPSITKTASVEVMTNVLIIKEATKTSFWFNGKEYSI